MVLSLFRSWYKSSRQSRGQARRKSGIRPRLEFLENRLAPAVLHVGPTNEPFTSIEAAVTAANPGDTIVVDAGTYHEHVVVDKPLTILGANANVNPVTSTRHAESIVDGDLTGAPFDIAANNVTINGFTIIDGQNGLNAGIATTALVSGYHIADNIITGNTIGVYANSSGAATIQDNLFDANNLAGPSGGAGIYSDQGTNGLVVTGNEFDNHTLNNPIIFGTSNGASNTNLTVAHNNLHNNVSGIYALAVSGGAFEFNTISTSGTGTGITFGGSDTNIDVLNNNLSNNARGLRIANFGDFVGVTANSDIRVHYNNFANDSQFGLGIQDEGNGPGYTGGDLDATLNWWGSASGPTTPDNPSGTGSAIVNDFATPSVIFKPWLRAPVTAATRPTIYHVNTLADIAFTAGQVNPANGRIQGQGRTVTLRSAIEAANETAGSSIIELDVAGTYKIAIPPMSPDDDDNLSGDFDIIPNAGDAAHSYLGIVNTSNGNVAVDGNNLDRVFDINPGGGAVPTDYTVVLRNFTIQNGYASPGDGAAGSGGGIRDQGNVNLYMRNMVVTKNRASADGGGLVMYHTTDGTWKLTVITSIISRNNAGDAGGGIDTDGAGTVSIAGSVIISNTDLNQGAGVYIDLAVGASPGAAGADMNMITTLVSHNHALAAATSDGQGGSGGGISNAGTGRMTITRSTISDNFAAGSGGGFDDENGFGTLDIRQSLFIDNSATLDGGAIREGGPSTSITSSEIRDNSSGADGGGIFADGLTLTIFASTLTGNTSAGNGGALELQTTGTGSAASTITDVTIAGNSALNNAGASGGGIDAPAAFTGDVSLLNDTINANVADNGGGVFWAGSSGTFTVQNTIIAQNAATTGPDASNPTGSFTDNGNNLIGIAGGDNSGFTAGSDINGDTANPLDPMLEPLGNYGGPIVGTPAASLVLQTEKPGRGSPAINNGNASAAPRFDERGFLSVIRGRANIGAVSQATHK